MDQAASVQHHRRLASGRTADEFAGPRPVAHTKAGTPADAAPLADSGGDAVRAADRHATPDGDAAADEPGHHHAADPGAHLVSDRVGNALVAPARTDGVMPKAVRFEEYGGADVLNVVDVPRPEPGPGQVLSAPPPCRTWPPVRGPAKAGGHNGENGAVGRGACLSRQPEGLIQRDCA